MIGNVKLKGCSPMLGGWWTDLQKALQSGAVTAAQLLNLYKQGSITQEQYFELQKIAAKSAASGSGSGIDNKTILIVGGVAIALLAFGGIIGTSRK